MQEARVNRQEIKYKVITGHIVQMYVDGDCVKQSFYSGDISWRDERNQPTVRPGAYVFQSTELVQPKKSEGAPKKRNRK